jgi:hypothetical protein
MTVNFKTLEVSHPTDRPNFTYVRLAGCCFWISYQTVIAFDGPGTGGLRIIRNYWGPTTGKHLNYVDEDKDLRLDSDTFHALLANLEARISVTLDGAAS